MMHSRQHIRLEVLQFTYHPKLFAKQQMKKLKNEAPTEEHTEE